MYKFGAFYFQNTKLIMLKVYKYLFCVSVLIVVILLGSSSCGVKKVTNTENIEQTQLKNTLPADIDTEFYDVVEKPAIFQNGDIKTFFVYLKKNTKYPLQALKKNQQGSIVVQFGIDCYGSIKVFSILKSSGIKLLDNEVLRAIKSSPKWTPAKLTGKSVGQLYMAQIKFSAKTKSVEIKQLP